MSGHIYTHENYDSKLMKKFVIVACVCLLSAFCVMGCQRSEVLSECKIEGTASGALNGKKIYLVPLNGPQDRAHVDSAVIENGKFEFSVDTLMMAVLRVELRARYGYQELLVITESGTVHATIGEVSTAGGTPQNDSLQVWKSLSEEYHTKNRPLMMQLQQTSTDDSLKAGIKSVMKGNYQSFKSRSRYMADGLKKGVLYDFLDKMFPKDSKE